LVERLSQRATLELVDGADHSFHVLARSGRTDAQVRDALLDTFQRWAANLATIPG
jgi:dienelactone hydrolase